MLLDMQPRSIRLLKKIRDGVFIWRISNNIFKAVIFCHTRHTAKWLAEKMHAEGYVVALLSGELDVASRAKILKRFRDGKERVLVTTNVCARGIDVEQVTLVVNFDLPMTKVCLNSATNIHFK